MKEVNSKSIRVQFFQADNLESLENSVNNTLAGNNINLIKIEFSQVVSDGDSGWAERYTAILVYRVLWTDEPIK